MTLAPACIAMARLANAGSVSPGEESLRAKRPYGFRSSGTLPGTTGLAHFSKPLEEVYRNGHTELGAPSWRSNQSPRVRTPLQAPLTCREEVRP